MEALPILFQDEWLVAVLKPAGLLVHRTDIARGQTDRFALQIVRDQLGRYVYPVHRIDRPTAGILLFGLDEATTRTVKAAFDEKAIEKRYLAIVRGRPPEAGEIEKPLKKVHAKRPSTEPQAAHTRYRRLATTELPIQTGRYPVSWYSLLEAAPLTGRTHQIRRHLAHINSPIIGDTSYGDNTQNKFFRAHFDSHRLMLFAAGLAFRHPHSDEVVRINARPDEEWAQVSAGLGWDLEGLLTEYEGNLSSF